MSSSQRNTNPKQAKPQTSDDYALTTYPNTKIPIHIPHKSHTPLHTSNQFDNLTTNFQTPTYAKAASDKQPQTSKSQASPYLYKPFTDNLFLTAYLSSDGIEDNHLTNICKSAFPSGCHWFPDNPEKTQRFYEFILIDSNSITLLHRHKNDDKTQEIQYTKCQIKKVIQFKDWPQQHPYYPVKFSKPFKPSHYTYYDYKMAWYYAFLVKPFTHTTFFIFHPNFSKDLPTWFFAWWQYFGLTFDQLPSPCREGASYYLSHATGSKFTRFTYYMAEFRIPWIFCWEYQLEDLYDSDFPLTMTRVYKVRWWDTYDPKFASLPNVKRFLLTGEKLTYSSNPQPPTTPQKQAPSKSKGKAPASPQQQLQTLLANHPELSHQLLETVTKTVSNEPPDETHSAGSENSPHDPFLEGH